MRSELYPILEYDENEEALINPFKENELLEGNELVITFFSDVINKLYKDKQIIIHKEIKGENTLTLYRFVNTNIYIMQGIIGCPACAGFLDEVIGLGIKKVMFCGGGGVLDRNIMVGKLLVVKSAIRDEGFSYHYVTPSRTIESDEKVRKVITKYLIEHHIDYIEDMVWTTDAFYRETKTIIQARKQEGARIVEMEQAGCLAVSQFRNIKYGAIIYGGDDVSGDKWNERNWRSRDDIRYNLVQICKELVQKI